MKEELVSIIVPIYNTAPYLKRCIESLIEQIYPLIEIILINDGSTDNSLDICLEYAKKDKRIKVLSQRNSGQSVARNKGIRHSRGSFITFVDSDDSIEVNTISACVQCLQSHPNCDYVQYPIHRDIGHNVDGVPKDYIESIQEIPILGSEALLKAWVMQKISWVACAHVYRRELIEKVKFKEGFFFEDNLFACDIVLNSRGVCFSQDGLYNYYWIETSTTHGSWSSKRWLDMVLIHIDIYKRIKERGLSGCLDAMPLYLVANDMFSSWKANNYKRTPITDAGVRILCQARIRDFIFASHLSLRRKIKILGVKIWAHIAQ
ncbi:glycosyltransferase family 2 protein [Porphyromonas sp. COT-290 OH860]|uniref:glycosyltransferase family 2 protein n=1 Tax=Porphyromonas sp. COT-290 OH860 TaxID=1515615 RepID=UPI0006944DB7|nr:glycosyltransferase family 2 protein [Porphyromonas sp. COT-290 OH860]